MYIVLITIISLLSQHYCDGACAKPSLTTASGTHAPKGEICSGDLIFEDNFDNFDLKVWNHEETLAGGGNWEFQWYNNNRSNSFVANGILNIKPTLLSDDRGEKFLYSGTLDINGNSPVSQCTDSRWYGCLRTGNRQHIVNPVKSAKIRTVHSFSFCYGYLEVRAKLPKGDWLWPAIWLLPRENQYGSWPTSGEIDLMEGRGNENLLDKNGNNIGQQQFGSTLHWGPTTTMNLYQSTNFVKRDPKGFTDDFHRYQLDWTEEAIIFSIDDVEIGKVVLPEGGFWKLGNLTTSGVGNPWKSGSKMAPFDQEFYVIMNLAVGSTGGYFPDDATNPGGKPWLNNSTRALSDFWEGRKQWLPTWKLQTNKAALKIDYVKIWAI